MLENVIEMASCAFEEQKDYREAMKEEELKAHQCIETWDLIRLPEGRKVVGSKLDFKRNEMESKQFVCKPNRSICNLRQSTKRWNRRLNAVHSNPGSKESTAEKYLLYLAVVERPDITNTGCDVKQTSFDGDPGQRLLGYPDDDWTGDPNDRHREFFFRGSAITWTARFAAMNSKLLSIEEEC